MLIYKKPQMREDWSHEILFALRAILFKLSIWDHNASYGAALQGLRYTDSRSKGPVHSAPTKLQKTMYGLLTVGGRYAWEKWESWLVGQEGGYEEVSHVPHLQAECPANVRIQPSQEVRMFSRITDLVSTTHSVAAFVSFLVFLVNGRYRTLVDRILRIRLTPPSAQASREVSFEYLNRQLVWHAFTEFLLFLLPLVGISRWKRWISRAWRKTVKALKSSGDDDEVTEKQGELAFLPERTCAICYRDQNPAATTESDILAASAGAGGISGSAQTDITNPYETIPCGCVYCFVCIVQKLEGEEGQGWVCLRCGEVVKKCQPWNGDVLEEARSQPGTGKIVGFAIDEEPHDDAQDAENSQEQSGKSSPLEEITADVALQHNQWSTDEKEPEDDEPTTEANGVADNHEKS